MRGMKRGSIWDTDSKADSKVPDLELDLFVLQLSSDLESLKYTTGEIFTGKSINEKVF